MAKVQISVEVSKSADDLGKALVAVARAVKDAVADGWNPLTDVPAIVLASIGQLGSAAAAVPRVAPDVAEDWEAFARGIVNRSLDVAHLFQAPAPKA